MAVSPAAFENPEAEQVNFLAAVPDIDTIPGHTPSHSIAVGGLYTTMRQLRLYTPILNHAGAPLPPKDRYFPPHEKGLGPVDEMVGQLVEDLEEVTERVEGPVAMFTHSLGAHIGSAAVLQRPDLVSRFTAVGGVQLGIKSLTPVGHGVKALLRHAKGVEDIMHDSDYMQAHAREVATGWPAHVPVTLFATPWDELATFADTLDMTLPPGQTAEKRVIAAPMPGMKWILQKTMGLPRDAELMPSLVPALHELLPLHPSVITHDRHVRGDSAEQAASFVVATSASMPRPRLASVAT